MAAFQPSEDNTHDLGTTTARWKELYIKNITTSGSITNTVTETTQGAYVVDTDQDDHIINASHQVTLLGAGVAAPAGREIIIVNTSDLAINITTNDTANLYVDGSATGLSSNHSLAARKTLKIIGVGNHWYAV